MNSLLRYILIFDSFVVFNFWFRTKWGFLCENWSKVLDFWLDETLGLEVGQSWNFFKIIWFLNHFKALDERISAWVYFLNLVKRFWRYLNFSAPKKSFLGQNLHIWNGNKKNIFDGFFFNFPEVLSKKICQKWPQNLRNFMELDMKKSLILKAVTFGVWGLKTNLRYLGQKPLARDLSSHKS